MADGGIINEHIKLYLESSGAISKPTNKTTDEITSGVMASLGTMVTNASKTKFVILSLLLSYSNMCKQKKVSAVRTDKDTVGFWLDTKNRDANPDTDISADLKKPAAAAVGAADGVAESMSEVLTAATESTDELLLEASPTASTPSDGTQTLLRSAIQLHEARVMSDTEFIAVIKRIAAA